MTLDQSALLDVLDALKTAEVDDRVRQAAETIYQALIEAELTAVIGAAPYQRHAILQANLVPRCRRTDGPCG
jgi:putative transposase